MANKSFNTNVAMNWVSADIQSATAPAEEVKTPAETKVEETVTEQKQEKEDGKKTVTKKETSPKKARTETQAFTIVGKELKKRQTSLLLKESTYNKLEALSKKNGISVNSCINQILEQVLS